MLRWLLILLMLTLPVGADPLPDYRLDLKLETMRGHELGYLRPQEGERLVLNLRELPTLRQLDFTSRSGQKPPNYVPIPGYFQVQSTQGPNGWSALRAVAEEGTHRVTLDILRDSGQAVVGWILIESHGHISGVLQLSGTLSAR